MLRDNYVGRAKLVMDRPADMVVGATFVGTGVAELIHSATMAVVAKIPIPVLWHAVPSYPTAQRGLASPAGDAQRRPAQVTLKRTTGGWAPG